MGGGEGGGGGGEEVVGGKGGGGEGGAGGVGEGGEVRGFVVWVGGLRMRSWSVVDRVDGCRDLGTLQWHGRTSLTVHVLLTGIHLW